jgi:NAD(P)-dependent dehydrogenase (short-subunit alcohol dehydrogenase family)
MEGGRRIVEAALDSFGRLDGIATFAGITVTKYLWELDESDWDDVIAVHLKGHFSCAQAAARVMMDQGGGTMVFIGSGAMIGPPNMPSYAAAKAGILGLTWSSAYALDRYGINVNCLVPSAATRMSDSIYGDAGVLTDKVGETIRSDLAEGTYRDPANIAPIVVYLLSDAAKGINGQVFRAQGYEVSHLAGLVWDKSMKSEGPWSADAIASRLPDELGPTLTPRPVPWPERPR